MNLAQLVGVLSKGESTLRKKEALSILNSIIISTDLRTNQSLIDLRKKTDSFKKRRSWKGAYSARFAAQHAFGSILDSYTIQEGEGVRKDLKTYRSVVKELLGELNEYRKKTKRSEDVQNQMGAVEICEKRAQILYDGGVEAYERYLSSELGERKCKMFI